MTHHRIIFADAREMPELDDESVHLVVTSPPYWCIKDYGRPAQIGREQPYAEYIEALGTVFGECHRVLHKGCRMAVNVGDQYLRAKDHGRYRIQPIPADLTAVGREVGFDFMGSIIWRKVSTTNTTGGGSLMGSIYYPKDGHITYEHEYILLFRKRGKWPTVPEEAKERSRLTLAERSEWFRGVWDDIPPERQDRHAAMFPVELPRRLVKMYSFWGETVLDPFMGSGTTALAAAGEGRSSIGYEINPEFEGIIREKLDARQPSARDGERPQLEFIYPEARPEPVADHSKSDS
ncbi:MAG: site-specific DNA-methyltransferase [Armatimonadota bacterium]|nr:site-specific DNA-methyltransferase [Armatimonadota bacterium]